MFVNQGIISLLLIAESMPTESICFDSGRNNTFTFSIGMLSEGGGGEAAQTVGQDRRVGRSAEGQEFACWREDQLV